MSVMFRPVGEGAMTTRLTGIHGGMEMNKILRGIAVGVTAAACVVGTATSASAGTTWESTSGSYKGCKNIVTMWVSGSKVKAYGTQVCSKKALIMRPTVALSGNNGKTFASDGKACAKATKCVTPTISLPMTKGWTYRASNSGSATTGAPGEADGAWPKHTIAHVAAKAPF
ncbi:hypothetical protein ACQPZG_04975 (plasmid) [Streptomyces sp. CA-294286]|uniref:hypothetical protein n=1 Tax=Streptomyces sp. CA-294286 TaxID=3240070 RepID=UPI003D8B8AD6